MRLSILSLFALAFSSRAGMHDVPPEARGVSRIRGRRVARVRALSEWRHSRAEQRLARLELVHDASGIITDGDAVEVADPDAVIELRHVRNAAKRQRRAIRAQGGQA